MMKQLEKLLPVADANTLLDKKTGEVATIKYAPGQPRQYRLNLSGQSGKFNLNGETDLTKKGQDFKFVPIGYRVFVDALFDRPRMTWAEIYFINRSGHVGMFMLNKYSADNFQSTLLDALFYSEAELGQIRMTAKIEKKEGKNGAYYMAFFEAEELTEEESDIISLAVSELPPLYRKDTITGEAEELRSENWASPYPPALEEEAADVKQLEEAS